MYDEKLYDELNNSKQYQDAMIKYCQYCERLYDCDNSRTPQEVKECLDNKLKQSE